jgi:hypothetical protein
MTTAGRNDPCPCGSGRKHKDCCAGAERGHVQALASARARDSALAKLLTFAFEPVFDKDHSIAESVFWGERIRNGSAAELAWLMDSEDANIKYNAWFLFDWSVDGSSTVADLFIEESGTRLTPAERQFLNRLSRAHLRLYEVEEVNRGEGVWLLDLWTGARLYVVERTASAEIVTWDLLGGRVAPDGMGHNVFEGGLYLYPMDVRDEIVGHFRRLYRRYERKVPGGDMAGFFRSYGMVFNHLWVDYVVLPEPPEVTTSDGDPLVFCHAVFDAETPEAVRALVERQSSVRRIDDQRLAWTDPQDCTRVLGTWSFEGGRIVFEAVSQERAARGRAWLEALAGSQVRYRATALETVDQAMNELRRMPVQAPPEPEEADAGAVRRLYDRHYRAWLDRPVPALGNRTPRAAAGTRIWRARLIDLLKSFENKSERAALHGRPPYHFGWIWQELGLERPRR